MAIGSFRCRFPSSGDSPALYSYPILIPALSIQNPVLPEAGAIVHVRQRLYLVEQVVLPPSAGEATLVRLSCVDDDAQGQSLDVLWNPNSMPRLGTVKTGNRWLSGGSTLLRVSRLI
jgi:hypothetical protein